MKHTKWEIEFMYSLVMNHSDKGMEYTNAKKFNNLQKKIKLKKEREGWAKWMP